MADKVHVMAFSLIALGECWGLHNDCWGHHGSFYRHSAYWLKLITWGHHACTYKPEANCDEQVMTRPHESSRCSAYQSSSGASTIYACLRKQSHCMSYFRKAHSLLCNIYNILSAAHAAQH